VYSDQKNRHPERSWTVSEASWPAESKDPLQSEAALASQGILTVLASCFKKLPDRLVELPNG